MAVLGLSGLRVFVLAATLSSRLLGCANLPEYSSSLVSITVYLACVFEGSVWFLSVPGMLALLINLSSLVAPEYPGVSFLSFLKFGRKWYIRLGYERIYRDPIICYSQPVKNCLFGNILRGNTQ